MNYSDWSGLFAAVGVIAFLQLALAIVGIIGSLISLVHSLNEETKRTSFIVFSSLGLGIGVLGFWNLIFAILGFIFMMISLSQDAKFRNYMAYILIVILITGIGGTGYTFLSNKMLDKLEESTNDLSNVGMDTLNQLDAGISNQNAEVTYQDTNTTVRHKLGGVAVYHEDNTVTTLNENGESISVQLDPQADGTSIATDVNDSEKTYVITKIIYDDGCLAYYVEVDEDGSAKFVPVEHGTSRNCTSGKGSTSSTSSTGTAQDVLNREGVAILHSGGTYTTYNKNSGVQVTVKLTVNSDGSITATDMYTNTYIITKVVNEDGDTIQVYPNR